MADRFFINAQPVEENPMLSRIALYSLIAMTHLLAPFASAAIIGNISTSSNYNASPQPDVYNLNDDGSFNNYFFSPFAVGDLAWDSGTLLVGHSVSGTIARTDERGGLLDLIYTPATSIDGLAVASTGEIYAAEGNSNRLFKLNTTGQLLGISFLPSAVTALGITSNDELIFARRNGSSSSSPYDVVFWDFLLGETSSFATDLRSVQGITGIGDDILLSSSGYYTPTPGLSRYTAQGIFVESLTGPANILSITAHAPEPGTGLLMGLGLAGLSSIRRAGAGRNGA